MCILTINAQKSLQVTIVFLYDIHVISKESYCVYSVPMGMHNVQSNKEPIKDDYLLQVLGGHFVLEIIHCVYPGSIAHHCKPILISSMMIAQIHKLLIRSNLHVCSIDIYKVYKLYDGQSLSCTYICMNDAATRPELRWPK